MQTPKVQAKIFPILLLISSFSGYILIFYFIKFTRTNFLFIFAIFERAINSFNIFLYFIASILKFLGLLSLSRRRRRRRLKRYPLQVRHKQDWGRGFILLLPQTAALPGSDAGSDVIKPASSFVIQNRQTSCSMWCPMYGARC